MQYFKYIRANTVVIGLPAAIVSIQTAGEFLNWHPHLHSPDTARPRLLWRTPSTEKSYLTRSFSDTQNPAAINPAKTVATTATRPRAPNLTYMTAATQHAAAESNSRIVTFPCDIPMEVNLW